MMRKLIVIAILLLLLSQPARAQTSQVYAVYLPLVVDRPCTAENIFITCHMEPESR